jgi:hypothetical protein
VTSALVAGLLGLLGTVVGGVLEVFAVAAAERGATALKAITGPQNERSILFHRKLGFEMTHVDDYGGTGRARLIMRRPLYGPSS